MGAGGIGHWIIILLIVMIFFGSKKLPELGKGLGEAIRSFKKGLDGNEIDVTKSNKQDSIKEGEKKDS
ncbi:MAG: twin-arginine translocase TatA/TatE family subunit [Bdellovibrionaceae bacterium]|nr:twin-arginine translocase TatA/TatE family subunit [Pseudobdellovibrionaceae bacterium]